MSQLKIAKWAEHIKPNALQKGLEFIDTHHVSFGNGIPDLNLLPIHELDEILHSFELNSGELLQYKVPDDELKFYICKLLKLRNVNCKPENIFLTAGAQQALSLLACLFLNKDDYVMLEKHCYPGFLNAFKPFCDNVIHIDSTQAGPDLRQIQSSLERNVIPACVYLMANGHNPLGYQMSNKVKQSIVNLAEKYDFPIIEDDAYGLINYEAPSTPLRSLSTSHVIYVGSLSKILSPSLRIGWLVAPRYLIEKLASIKEGFDLNISRFSYNIATAFLKKHDLPKFLVFLNAAYKKKRDLTLSCLEKYCSNMPLSYSSPSGGFYIWINFENEVSVEKLKHHARIKKLSFITGDAFSLRKTGFCRGIRLAFSSPATDTIDEGIKRLSMVLNDVMELECSTT